MSNTSLIIPNPWMDNNNLTVNKYEDLNDTIDRLEEIAKRDLREDERTKKQCLQNFKEWIQKNQDIENCFTDDKFLLKFLRFKKFSVPMAEQTLLKYLNFRKRFRDYMYGLDYLESVLIDKGYIIVSPFRDSYGRRVIIYNVKKINPHEFTGRDIAFAHAITYETLLTEEENQILGVNHVADVEGLGAPFLTLWSISEFATIIRWGEQSLPMRHREINVLHFPAGFKYVYDFVHSNIRSEKLKNRIKFHDDLSDLHNQVHKRCLPQELGGVMPAKEMLELWKQELANRRKLLLSYDSMNLLSDKGIICRRNGAAVDETGAGSLPGSFRRLEVD